MKKTYIRLIIPFIAAFATVVTFAQDFEIFLFEDFEHGGSRPPGWTEQAVIGTRTWRFQEGGGAPSGLPEFRHPMYAYSGSYNALFQDQSVGPARRLITPAIDLRTAIKPTLTFWHAMDAWGSSVDELKVYYRKNNTSSWVLLEHYTLEAENWTRREIQLPDEARTQTCQIAFEGISNWGWGVCIDDVKVEEKGVLPRQVESFTLKQFPGNFPSGSDINPFAYLSAFVTGNNGNIPVNSIQLDFTGTDINDIEEIRLFHTRDSVFTTGTYVPAVISITGNQITIEAPSFNLFTGDNYLWIVFDIESSAIHGNTVDFVLPANSVFLGENYFPSSQLSPAPKATIFESMFYDDFESGDNWVKTDLWEIGLPLGGGLYDPLAAYSGNNVLATNLNGNYPPGISPSDPHTTVFGSVDATYYQNLNITYKRWLNIEYFDKATLDISNNGGVDWNRIYESNTDVLDRHWRTMSHNINTLAKGRDNIMVKFALNSSNSYTEYGGWNIDNFAITGEFIHSDVGVTAMSEPLQACGLTGAETVRVTVRNFGGATVSTPFEVGYSIDGGNSFVKEWFSDPIASEADPAGDVEMEFTFLTPADLTVPGLKNMVFSTFLDGDQNNQNNTFNKTFYVFPSVSFPYQASFESSASHWHQSGTNSTWQWGTPAGNIIKTASHGNRVWATSLTKNYKNNELSYLESPCFDLTDASYPVFSFDYVMQVEAGVDGLAIEYSVDGGMTWYLLPASENFSFNWYNTENVTALGTKGWSQNHETYKTAATLLPAEATGIDGVKFRFVLASDGNNNFEGVALDMIRLYEMPYDVGIAELVSPQNACEIGYDVPLELKVENFGYRPVPAGTKIPVRLSVTGNSLKSDTLALTVDLNQGETENIGTQQKFTMYSSGLYDVVAYSLLAGDYNRNNDTLTTQVDVYGMPGYSIGPDIGTMSPDTVILDAGTGYEFYNWYKQTGPDTWDPVGSISTYEVPGSGWGIYRVEVTSFESCTATDTLEIIESDKNTGVTAILNLTDECEYPLPISPEVTIRNYGPATYNGIEGIPVSIMVNGAEVHTEMFIPDAGFAENNEVNFTFTGSIDLSEAKTYNISIYTNLPKDLNKGNDTTHKEITVYGMPDVTMVTRLSESYFETTDTIATVNADTIVFATNGGFMTYLWEQKKSGEVNWVTVGTSDTLKLTDIPDNLPSAWYRVTVTDTNGCGSDSDSIYVNAADLGIAEIINPADSICYTPAGTIISVLIKNYGHDIIPAGTDIQAEAITPAGIQNLSYNTSVPLGHNDELSFEFAEAVLLPEGDNFIIINVAMDGDPNGNNDFQDMLVTVSPLPEVTIDPGTVYKIFEPSGFYQIAPEYSEDVIKYNWHDGHQQANYNIWGIPAFEKYSVTAENQFGCVAIDSIKFVTADLRVGTIVSPASDCELADNVPVVFVLENTGNTTFLQDTEIDVTVSIGGTVMFTETVMLAAHLFPQNSVNITTLNNMDLAHLDAATIGIEISTGIEEVNYENNSRNRSVYAMGYPVISLGEDRVVKDWEEVISPGPYYSSYLWQDSSTDSTFTVIETGTYHVAVVDFSGCPGYDTVNIQVVRPDYGVTGIIEPVSDCSHTANEQVRVTLKNFGTDTLFIANELPVILKVNGTTVSEETIVFENRFNPGDEIEYTFLQTIDLSEVNTYQVRAETNHPLDLVPENNGSQSGVETYGYPVILITSFNEVCADAAAFELTQGTPEGGVYSGTGVTEGYFDPSEAGAGTHLITYTYTDANNCTSVTDRSITVNALPVITLTDFDDVCIDTAPFTLSGGGPLSGVYSGTGVSGGVFDPAGAGEGIHPITYTFTDAKGCTNSASKNITVNSLPVLTLAGFTPACINTEDFELTGGGPGGGEYSGTAIENGIFSPALAGLGNHQVTYTYTDNNGCTSSASAGLLINDIPEVTITEIPGVYLEDAPFDLTQGSPLGGNYSGTGVTGNVFDPQAAGIGTHIITYSYTDNNSCTNFDQTELRVYEVTEVFFPAISPACIDAPPFNLTGGIPEGGEYSGPGVAGGVFDPAEAGAGIHTLVYTIIDELGNPVSAQRGVTVNALPSVTLPITFVLCEGSEDIELTTGSPGGGEYSGTGVSNSFFSPVSAGVGTHLITYTYTDGNGCTNSATGDLTVSSPPEVDLGPDRSTTEPLVLDAGAGFEAYLWQDGSTGRTFTVTATGLYHVTVTDQNGCNGYGEVFITYVLVPEPVISSVEMDDAACHPARLPAGVTIGNTGTGAVPAGASLGIIYQVEGRPEVIETIILDDPFEPGASLNHTFAGPLELSTGLYRIYFRTLYNSQTSADMEHQLEVHPLPDADLGPENLDVTLPHTLTAGGPGDTYLWSTGSTESSITVNAMGKYWLRLTSSHGCVASDTIFLQDVTSVHQIPGTQNSVSVYPNPVRHLLNIEVTAEKPDNFNIELISLQGRMVYQTIANGAGVFTHEIDVSRFAPGVYLLRVAIGGKWAVTRIVIDR